jgi:hypothetical protein
MQVWTVILEMEARYTDVSLYQTREGAVKFLMGFPSIAPQLQAVLDNRGETFSGVLINGYAVSLVRRAVL